MAALRQRSVLSRSQPLGSVHYSRPRLVRLGVERWSPTGRWPPGRLLSRTSSNLPVHEEVSGRSLTVRTHAHSV